MSFGNLLLLATLIGVLAELARSPRVGRNVQFIAQTAEGVLVQDLETGVVHLLEGLLLA